MKWGRRKLRPPPPPPQPSSASASASRPSFISHVFPISWISKFKQKSAATSETKPKPPRKATKQQGKWNTSSTASMSSPKYDGDKFYGLHDDDAYWRLSFREDGAQGMKGRGVLRSVWYDSDDGGGGDGTCRNCRVNSVRVSERGEKQKKSNNGMHKCKKEKETGLTTPRCSRNEKELKLRKAIKKKAELGREQGKAEKRPTKYVEDDGGGVLEMEEFRRVREEDSGNRRKHHYNYVEGLEFDQNHGICDEKLSSDWKLLKQQKMEDIKAKSEEHRKSLHISRELQRRRSRVNSKVRVYSPRTTSRVETCKIKAIEDMKKAKLKMMKEEAKERIVQLRKGLDSFAVVKCSYDPQQDFRDSMVEMIMEKGINQPDDLEQLLASYLTLNSDEYHDLIIKVFRQVWFDMNQSCYDAQFSK